MGLLTKWKARNTIRRIRTAVANANINVDPEVVNFTGNYAAQLRDITPQIVGQDSVDLVRPDNTKIRVTARNGSLYSYTVSPQGEEREFNPDTRVGRDIWGTSVLEDMIAQNGGNLAFRDRAGKWLKKHGRWAGLLGGVGTVGLVWAYHAIPGTPKVTAPRELSDFITSLYTNMGPSLFYTAAGFLSAAAGAIPGYLGLRSLLEDDSRYTHLRLEGKGTVDEKSVITSAIADQLNAHRQAVDNDLQEWKANEEAILSRIEAYTGEQTRLTGLLRTYGEKKAQLGRNRANLQQSVGDMNASIRLQLSLFEQTRETYYQEQVDAYSRTLSSMTEILERGEQEIVKITADEEQQRKKLEYVTGVIRVLQTLYDDKQSLERSKEAYRITIPNPSDTIYGRIKQEQEALMRAERELLNRIDQGLPLN